jgi:hypothetical protein
MEDSAGLRSLQLAQVPPPYTARRNEEIAGFEMSKYTPSTCDLP